MAKAKGLFAALILVSSLCAADSETGVIIMANNGPKAWTRSVSKSVREAELPYPNRVFFGAGDSPAQQRTLQSMVNDLEDGGANTIVVVPLTTSPFSEAYRQWKYLFGLDVQPGFNNTPLFPVNKHSTIRFAEPLNDSAVVVEIMLDRIQEISRKPEDECVIIVAPGPKDNDDNTRWEQILQSLSRRIRERGKFKSVEAATLRDEAASQERERSLHVFRARVERAQSNGRALVIPLVLSAGGIEHKVSLELRGISYTYNNKALMPDSRISEWMRSQLP